MEYCIKNFSDLTGKEVYDICRLRSSVFVLEQKIVCEEELDGKDEVCRHLLVKAGDELLAYCRLVPKSHSGYNAATIGRVVVRKENRHQGLAMQMMKQAIKDIQETWQEKRIILSAQEYIVLLYAKLGFTVISEVYMEAGIAHVKMEYTM